MSKSIIRVYEGDPLPDNAVSPKLLATEDVVHGTGTATRRLYTLLVEDGRYWLTDEEKYAEPLGASR